jgi:hypothetical protein
MTIGQGGEAQFSQVRDASASVAVPPTPSGVCLPACRGCGDVQRLIQPKGLAVNGDREMPPIRQLCQSRNRARLPVEYASHGRHRCRERAAFSKRPPRSDITVPNRDLWHGGTRIWRPARRRSIAGPIQRGGEPRELHDEMEVISLILMIRIAATGATTDTASHSAASA